MSRIAILFIPELSYKMKFEYGIDIYFGYGIMALLLAAINVLALSKTKNSLISSSNVSIGNNKNN